MGRVKLNTDGCAKGNPGYGGGGSILMVSFNGLNSTFMEK